MSSAKSVTPRHIELQPSRRLRQVLTALYLGALASVIFLPQPVALRILLALIVLLSYPITLNRIGWFNTFNERYPRLFRPPVTGVSWREGGEWQLLVTDHTGASQSRIDAQLLPASTVLPYLTVLNFYCERQSCLLSRLRGCRVALVLLPDSLAKEDFRQLRVRLLSQPLSPIDNAVE